MTCSEISFGLLIECCIIVRANGGRSCCIVVGVRSGRLGCIVVGARSGHRVSLEVRSVSR